MSTDIEVIDEITQLRSVVTVQCQRKEKVNESGQIGITENDNDHATRLQKSRLITTGQFFHRKLISTH